jgi:hypothetical protein
MHGERHQAHPHRGVEALHRLHETYIAFLHQVAHGQTVAQVSAGNVHHEPQVREHQLPGGVQVSFGAKSNGEGDLVFLR